MIDFWARWCGPCQALSPIVDEIAREHQGRLKVVRVDVGQAPRAAAKYGVSSIPCMVILHQGKVKAQLSGLRPKQVLLDAVTPYTVVLPSDVVLARIRGVASASGQWE